jgi:8-hydroxy-5-deazaflavin:NADPH oxidoreductase
MHIAIIGSGNVGSALARAAARAGHTLTITSRNPEEAERLARSVDARTAASNVDVIDGADVVILAVPATTVVDVAGELGDAARGTVLVDVTNRPTPDGPPRVSIAEEIQQRAPDAHVVKAINTVFAARQADPDIGGTPADGYVAGDDEDAKKVVLSFVESIGLTPYDVGPLAFARTLEGMAWIHISLAMHHNWPWQSAWKIVGPKG